MSFGVGVGDIFAVVRLSWTVYRACKGSSREFQELSREVNTLHTVLKELEDEANNDRSTLNRKGGPRKEELLGIIRNIEAALKELDDLVTRYESLGRQEKRTWDRVRFASENLDTTRGKLTFYVASIGLFMDSLTSSSLARIEIVLEELVKEFREGKRPATIVSVHETVDLSVWRELESELSEEGISKEDAERHKDAIKSYLKGLMGATGSTLLSPSGSLPATVVAGTEEDGPDDEGWDSISVRVAGKLQLQDAQTIEEEGHELEESSEEEFGGEERYASIVTPMPQKPETVRKPLDQPVAAPPGSNLQPVLNNPNPTLSLNGTRNLPSRPQRRILLVDGRRTASSDLTIRIAEAYLRQLKIEGAKRVASISRVDIASTKYDDPRPDTERLLGMITSTTFTPYLHRIPVLEYEDWVPKMDAEYTAWIREGPWIYPYTWNGAIHFVGSRSQLLSINSRNMRPGSAYVSPVEEIFVTLPTKVTGLILGKNRPVVEKEMMMRACQTIKKWCDETFFTDAR